MSIIRVNEVDLNDAGNASVQIANSWNVALVTSSVIRLEARTDGSVVVPGALTANSMNVSGALTASAIIPPSSFLRNRIINGAMHIWQRGTSFSSGYTADRWYHSYGDSPTFARSTDTPSAAFPFSMSVSGSNFVTLAQRIESVNSYDLVGQPVTVSFWVKQTSGAGTNSIGVQIFFPTATDNYTSVTGTTNNFITATSGWTYVTTTFSAGTLISQAANGIALSIFANIAGSSTFLVTGIQLEVGSIATPFERRQYGQELALCQRYYYNGGTLPGAAVGLGAGPIYATGPSGAQTYVGFYPVTMRASPTVTVYDAAGTSGRISYYTSFWNNGGTIANLAGLLPQTFFIQVNIAGSNYISGQYQASAEL